MQPTSGQQQVSTWAAALLAVLAYPPHHPLNSIQFNSVQFNSIQFNAFKYYILEISLTLTPYTPMLTLTFNLIGFALRRRFREVY